jgi:ribosomal protein L7/L12
LNADQLIKLVQLTEETQRAGDTDVLRHLNKALRVGVISFTRDPEKLTHGLTHDEIRTVQERGKIHAIKMYRERTGSPLREAKEAVENCMSIMNLQTPAAHGF